MWQGICTKGVLEGTWVKAQRWEAIFPQKKCRRLFVAKSGLTRHEATHRAEKPHACKTCGKGGFVSKMCFTAHEDARACKAPPVYETNVSVCKKVRLNWADSNAQLRSHMSSNVQRLFEHKWIYWAFLLHHLCVCKVKWVLIIWNFMRQDTRSKDFANNSNNKKVRHNWTEGSAQYQGYMLSNMLKGC